MKIINRKSKKTKSEAKPVPHPPNPLNAVALLVSSTLE